MRIEHVGGQCGRGVEDLCALFLEVIEVGKMLFNEVAFGFSDTKELIVWCIADHMSL